MEIIGINAGGEFFDEKNVSVKTLIENMRHESHLRQYDLEKYYREIEKLYKSIFSSNPGKTKAPIIEEGTLFHRSPFRDSKTGEVYYDKLKSIANNGLLPVDMLVRSPDATDSTYLSCHSVLNNERTLKDIFQRSPQGSIDLIFFINTNCPAIQKLISLGRHNEDNYPSPRLQDVLERGSTDDVLKKLFQIENVYCPDNIDVKGVCYLPIGVPAKYVSAIVVPDELRNDEQFMQILGESFENAVILDKDAKEIERTTKEMC